MAEAIWQAALENCCEAIALNPSHFEALQRRAEIYQHHGFFKHASDDYERMVELQPKNHAGYFGLAKVQKASYQNVLALKNINHALAIAPKFIEAQTLRYELLIDLREHDLLLNESALTVKAAPFLPDALLNHGRLLAYLQYHSEAMHFYELALCLDPRHENALKGKAALLIAAGRVCEAYALLPATALMASPIFFTRFSQPLWTGQESLTNKTLLVYAEQGQGDTIQRSRYALQIAKQPNVRVIYQVQPSLVRLMQTLSDLIVISHDDPTPKCDFVCSSLGLAAACSTMGILPPTLATPFLNIPSQWRRSNRPKIGLSWAGGQASQDFRRSLHLSEFLPLLQMQPFDFYSLQKEAPARQWVQIKQDPLFELGEQLNDYADTAAALTQLDLLICCDTSIAHLAGAIGTPVWMVTRLDEPPRELDATTFAAKPIAELEDSLWYSSMKLFRQKQFGDWTDVISRVHAALLKHDFTSKNNAASR
jgi:tetratricopeptide (TPR) repeat protein